MTLVCYMIYPMGFHERRGIFTTIDDQISTLVTMEAVANDRQESTE